MAGRSLLTFICRSILSIVSEGHELALVASSIRNKFPDVSDITFHIDPEDDADIDRHDTDDVKTFEKRS